MEQNFGRIVVALVGSDKNSDKESEYAGQPFIEYIWNTLDQASDTLGPSHELIQIRSSLALMCIQHWGRRISNLIKNKPNTSDRRFQIWRQEGEVAMRVNMEKGDWHQRTLNTMAVDIEYTSGIEDSKVNFELVHNKPEPSLGSMTIKTQLLEDSNEWAPTAAYIVSVSQGSIQKIEKTVHVIGKEGYAPAKREYIIDFAA